MIAAGLLMGTFFEIRQAMAVWLNVLMVALIVPVPISGMAVDLPAMVNNALRWYPTVALSRLFQMSMSNQAPFAEWGLDLALVLGPALVLLAAVTWRLQRVNQ
jgi:ABC-type tungstate transport system substrate-binding protein